MTYAEHKRRVAELVDKTYQATLTELPARRYPSQPATVCRSAGGSGGATGDYSAKGDIEVPLGGDADLKQMIERVRAYWEAEGFEIVSVREDQLVLARDGEYNLGLRLFPKSDKALLGASGPCATPASEAEREARPKFKSVTAAGERGAG